MAVFQNSDVAALDSDDLDATAEYCLWQARAGTNEFTSAIKPLEEE